MATKADPEAADAARLGRELRGLRRTRGITLAELAGRCGRSVGHLSQVERGLSTLAIDDLRTIARLLGVPISWFLLNEPEDAREGGRIVRAERRRRIGSAASGLTEELLSPDLGGSFEVILSSFAPGAERRKAITRDTEETGYVVAGELELWIGGEKYRLAAGDSFRIAGEPTRWRNPGRDFCEVVWVIAPPVY